MAREFEILLADTEFFRPSSNPTFWFGGFLNLDTGEYQSVSNFGIFWQKLFVEIPKDIQRIVVFHNADYDMYNLQAHAVKELGYTFNPIKEIKDEDNKLIKKVSDKGLKKAIYQGQTWEIYSKETKNGVIVVDSLPLLRTSIAKLGNDFGLPKGETPIIDEWRLPTKSDEEYLKRDIVILERAFKEYQLEQAILQGQYTISSVAQADFKQIFRDKKGAKKHTNSIKHQFGLSNKKVDSNKTLLPYELKIALDEIKVQATNYLEEKFSDNDKQPIMKTPLKLVKEYVSDKKKQGLKEYRSKIKGFTKLKSHAMQPLATEEIKNQFLTLNIGLEISFDSEEFEKIIQDWLFKTTLIANNGMIRNGFRGGIIYLNEHYINDTLGKGFVIDAVSMYPSVMMKYDIPSEFLGTSEGIDPYAETHFVAEIKKLKAELKDGHYPCIKRNQQYFTKELKYHAILDWSVEKEKKTSMLTSVDIELLYENYNVFEIEYGKVHYYSSNKAFNDSVKQYITKWYEQKEKATKGSVKYVRAKHMLNNLWGRWAMYEKIVKQGGVEVDIGQKDVNLISALFITSFARLELNQAMNYFEERLIYSNTDSVHVLLRDNENLEDCIAECSHKLGNKLGLWDIETIFNRAKYISNNKYCLELSNKKLKTVISGIELENDRITTLDQFYKGKILFGTDTVLNEKNQYVIRKIQFKL